MMYDTNGTYSANQQIPEGVTVYDSTGEKIGTIEYVDSQAGYLVVQKGWLFHTDLYIPLALVDRLDADGVYLRVHKDELQGERFTNVPAPLTADEDDDTTYSAATTQDRFAGVQQGDVTVPVREEELLVGKERQEEGRVHLHKDVTEEQQTVTVPVQHERVVVERVPVSGAVDASNVQDAFVEQDIDVPLMGEEVVTDKRTNVKEEVRLRKETVTDNEQVSDTVRRERVTVSGDQIDTDDTYTQRNKI